MWPWDTVLTNSTVEAEIYTAFLPVEGRDLQSLKNVFVFNISPRSPIWSKLVVVLLVNFQELGRST